MNQTIHSIDLLRWMMGPVETVRAVTGTLAHTMETEDTATAILRFRSGALGAVTATTAAYPGIGTRLELLGIKGSAVIENDDLVFLRLARDTPDAGDYGVDGVSMFSRAGEPAVAAHYGAGAGGHSPAIADFATAIRENRPPMVDGHAARESVRLVLAMYDAARTGEEVVLE